jgi:hypothetical protein
MRTGKIVFGSVALALIGSLASADTGGRIASPAAKVIVQQTITSSSTPRLFDYDDRAAPHGADAAQNFPVPHPARALNIHLIAPAYAFNGLTKTDRMLVQTQLRQFGYYTGGIDGAWGPQTWTAVKAYAVALDLTPGLADMSGALGIYQHIAE